MLRWRLTLGILMVAVLAVVCWFDVHSARPGIYLIPPVLVLTFLASHEMLGFFHQIGHRPLAWVIYLGTLLPVMASLGPFVWVTYPADCPVGRLGWLAGGLIGAVLIAFVGEMKRTDNVGSSIIHLALACLSILYVGGLLGVFMQLRLLNNHPMPDQGDYGMLAWLSLVVVVKLSDIGQYTVGRIFGRHKLAKTLSPGKTWEGALGGILFAVIGACFSLGLLDDVLGYPSHRSWPAWLVSCLCFGMLVGIAGIVGDLAESMLKRDAGVKDSSQWLPGFGGTLDLLDSLLVAAPVAYICWITGIVGP